MMTKEQFDAEFSSGCCLVRADTMEEWRDLNEYAARELGIKKSNMLRTHDCADFPYVGVREDNQVSAWYGMPSGACSILSFQHFQATVSEDDVLELRTMDLGGIL